MLTNKAVTFFEFCFQHPHITAAISTILSSFPWSSTLHYRPVLVTSTDPITPWHRFATSIGLESKLAADIAEELVSAMVWQLHSYVHPPRAPGLDDPSIDWEQSIVEGHPTHPVRKLAPPLSA